MTQILRKVYGEVHFFQNKKTQTLSIHLSTPGPNQSVNEQIIIESDACCAGPIAHEKKVPVLNDKEANIKDINEKLLFCTSIRQTFSNLNPDEQLDLAHI